MSAVRNCLVITSLSDLISAKRLLSPKSWRGPYRCYKGPTWKIIYTQLKLSSLYFHIMRHAVGALYYKPEGRGFSPR
jgi:hypothetical protein